MPVTAKVYMPSSLSLLAIVTVAEQLPEVRGSKRIVSVVELEAWIVVDAGSVLSKSLPLTVMEETVRSAEPRFWMVKVV